jgi:hypothetical protein
MDAALELAHLFILTYSHPKMFRGISGISKIQFAASCLDCGTFAEIQARRASE